MTKETTASAKEKSDLLIGIVKDTYTGFIDFGFKHGTILLIIIGWIMTSERTQKIIAASPEVKSVVVSGALILTILFSFWCCK